MNDPFEIVGVRPELLERQAPEKENRWYQGVPWLSVIVLLIIAGGCLFCKWIMPKDPSYMDLKNYTVAPCREFLFGTDTMGRDIFSMIWYGGRQSLFIGFVATMISTSIAIIFGTVSGLAPEWLDMLLMRMTEILLSIPNLLLVIFLQAILGKANVLSLSLVIGVTSWTSIAKVVRTEVRQLRSNEYVVAVTELLKIIGCALAGCLFQNCLIRILSRPKIMKTHTGDRFKLRIRGSRTYCRHFVVAGRIFLT